MLKKVGWAEDRNLSIAVMIQNSQQGINKSHVGVDLV